MEKDTKKETYTISALAEEFDISTRSIRFYEEKNLISPQRTEGNQRFYTRRDRARLKLILRGKRFGYSLDEIAEIIGMTDIDIDEEEQIKKTLKFGKKRLDELRERIHELTMLEQDLATFQERIQQRLDELNTSRKLPVEEVSIHRTVSRRFPPGVRRRFNKTFIAPHRHPVTAGPELAMATFRFGALFCKAGLSLRRL